MPENSTPPTCSVGTAADPGGTASVEEEAGLTVPTEHVGGVEFSGMRLDYLFGSVPVAALTRSCRVPRGGEVECASDHRPVLAEIELHPA